MARIGPLWLMHVVRSDDLSNTIEFAETLQFCRLKKMYGWEKLSSMCGMGCRVFWNPWVQNEKSPYDAVMKEDVIDSVEMETVTNEPVKPIWTDLKIGTPIVRNKSNSMGNIRVGSSYSKLAATASLSKLNEKSVSKTDLSASKASLTASQERLQVSQMVTTV